MIKRKTLKELTIKDNFMFGAVMCDERNCRRLHKPHWGKYRYTFRQQCQEEPEALLDDGSMTIFLNTRGENPSEVSPELVKFLMYVRADLNESTADFDDDFVDSLQNLIFCQRLERCRNCCRIRSCRKSIWKS